MERSSAGAVDALAVPVNKQPCGPTVAATRLWLLFALALYLLQTLPNLSNRWVTDESWYAAPGYSVAQGHGLRDPAIGPNDLENRLDARPPGTALVIAGFYKLLGIGAIPARLGSVLAGLLIVFLTFRLTRHVLDRQAAVVAALLTATDNLIIVTARTARPEALTVMAVLLSLFAMQQYARTGERSSKWAGMSGLLMALAAMFHITVLGFVVSLGILVLAIDRQHHRPAFRGFLTYAGGFLGGLVPFTLWIFTVPLGRQGFHEEFLSRAIQTTIASRFINEATRYTDLLGFNMLPGHGLGSVPVRLPIPLFFVLAVALLWWSGRRWFYAALLLLLPTMLWLAYTVNKSSRYLALLSPFLAAAAAALVSVSKNRRVFHRTLLVCVGVVTLTELGANLFLLREAHHADYNRVAEELRQVIPPGATAYGTITFWLALHDRPFISYERTKPVEAATAFHAQYFILGDRMMVQRDSNRKDDTFYTDLNRQLADTLAGSYVVGRFHDSYYGDLTVYRVSDLR